MPRYKLTIEYAGTRYSGWQIQQNARTVQGELHRAVGEALRVSRFETYGSGRTDAGVHALAQVAHLDAATLPPPATLIRQVNDVLPHDINILSAERVPPRFHARHSAVARSYLYQIATRRTAFAKPFVWWVKEPLDLARMQAAAVPLTGFGDFRAFTDARAVAACGASGPNTSLAARHSSIDRSAKSRPCASSDRTIAPTTSWARRNGMPRVAR